MAYVRPFLFKQDYSNIKKIYNAMLEGQKGLYTKEDLDEFWATLIMIEHGYEQKRQGQNGFFWHVGISDEAYEFFAEMVKTLGADGKKARQELKDHAPENTDDSIENEIEELDRKIEGLFYKREQLEKKLKKRSR